MKKQITCLGCTHHFIHYSNKINNYSITDSSLEAFDSAMYLRLEEEGISHLINLLQYYKKFITDNKANLSEQLTFEDCIGYGNYYSIEGLAKLAREINETSKINKNH